MAEDTNRETNETAEQTADNANGEQNQSSGIVGGIVDTVAAVVSSVAETVNNAATAAANVITSATTDDATSNDAATENNGGKAVKTSRRAQKVGTVSSDKMTKTVVVNVDRQIMHPKYRRYVRRRTKFMAHDEMGAGVGDKVRIEETRPLSARKRWRVIEIVQKAAR